MDCCRGTLGRHGRPSADSSASKALTGPEGRTPLVLRQGGAFLARWLALGLLTYVALGVNTAIELTIFSTIGGTGALMILWLVPSVLCAGALAGLLVPRGLGESFAIRARQFWAVRTGGQWAWRPAGAVIAFPLVYWVFGGLLIAVMPHLMEYYETGDMGLTVPPPHVIAAVQILRSSLYLVTALPLLVMWTGSRRGLAVALGLAYAVTVGIFHMAQASFLPLDMRLGHGTEITLDSFAYAFVLVWLLVPRRGDAVTPPAEAA